ncbi:hypothetical protein Q5P01_006583 [Channa striata]|uniref:MARVEL domain-containing protein n=1 Tax=Channa striata TaxID=64152 RepID=A0AA88SX37_CHASR|nr:hypothetical protein Q5P01_006583 [Channa striata]
MDVDAAFVKSKRGILKIAEMVTLFIAFVCFAAASRPEFIAATLLELLIIALLLLLYLLKLNKSLTFFFWPFIDVFNSAFAAFYFIVLSVWALSTSVVTGTVVGGVVGLVSVVLLCVDGCLLAKNITFNISRHEAPSQDKQ